MIVRLPPLDEIARRWAEIEPLLAPATARTACYETIDLLRATLAGQMALWLIEQHDAALATAITEVRQYPRARVLDVPFIGGAQLGEWAAPLLEALDAYAQALGCDFITGSGRRGWVRFGFREDGPLLVREVTR